MVLSCPNTSAINTFFPKPIINLLTPSPNFSNVYVLSSSCFSIVVYLTIGPAINCGNNETYIASFKRFF